MDTLKRLATVALMMVAAPAHADELGRWTIYIDEASIRFGIPTSWIERVMRAESNGQTMLNGRPIRSRAGAMGLMQLMPATWAAMRARLALGANPDGRVGMKRFTPFTGASFFIPLPKPDVRVSPHPAFYARRSSRVVLNVY